MLRWVGLRLMGMLAALVSGSFACAAASTTLTPTLLPTPTTLPAPTPTATPVLATEWIEMEVEGITVGIQKPTGWHIEHTREGILLAEWFSSMPNSSGELAGVQLHLFIHAFQGFSESQDADHNIAWAVLDQIRHNPRYIGDARVSEPRGFSWHEHDAAYYLLNTGDGSVTMLIAVALPVPGRLLICNMSSPLREAGRIRQLLPGILGTLQINGDSMQSTDLERLPRLLIFPTYARSER